MAQERLVLSPSPSFIVCIAAGSQVFAFGLGQQAHCADRHEHRGGKDDVGQSALSHCQCQKQRSNRDDQQSNHRRNKKLWKMGDGRGPRL
jgi:hypothetical protein